MASAKDKKILPKKIVDGHMVMKVMGITHGTREVGEVMNALYDMQLEKKFNNKKEGLVALKKYLKKK